MRPTSKLEVAKKQAVSTTNQGQAVVTATHRDGRGMVHLSLWRKQRGAAHGVSGLDLTIPQAMRLRAILTDAIRAAVPEDAALAGVPEVDDAGQGPADEVPHHGGRHSYQAA